jgi:hypothetical protein
LIDELADQIHRYATTTLTDHAPIAADDVMHDDIRRPRLRRAPVAVVSGAILIVAVTIAVLLVRDPGPGSQTPSSIAGSTGVASPPTSWSSLSPIGDVQVFGIAASDKGIVAASYTLWFSNDGNAWQRATVEDLGNINDVITTATGFLAVGTSSDKHAAVWTSSDGLQWQRVHDSALEPQTPPIPDGVSTPYGSINRVAATPDGYVAVGSVFNGQFADHTLLAPPWAPAIWVSADGTHWSRRADSTALGTSPSGSLQLVGLATLDDSVFVVGHEATRSTIWQSTDTKAWHQVATIEGTVNDLTEAHGKLIAAGSIGRPSTTQARPTIWRADDPSSWSIAYQAPAANIADFSKLVTNGSYTLALGYRGQYEVTPDGLTLYSPDGATWQPALPHGQTFECRSTIATNPTCPAPAAGGSGYATAGTVLAGKFFVSVSEPAAAQPNDPPNFYRRRLTIFTAP